MGLQAPYCTAGMPLSRVALPAVASMRSALIRQRIVDVQLAVGWKVEYSRSSSEFVVVCSILRASMSHTWYPSAPSTGVHRSRPGYPANGVGGGGGTMSHPKLYVP